jgi:hypothetical protein
MSLLLFALITCGAAASGLSAGLLLRRGAARRTAELPAHRRSLALPVAGAPDDPLRDDTGEDPLPTLAIGLGDVVTRGEEEAAFGEALVFSEDGALLAALLRGTGPASSPWLWSAPRPATEAVWLHEIFPEKEDSSPARWRGPRAGAEAPLSLEIGASGQVFERLRRLPVVVAHVAEPTDAARHDDLALSPGLPATQVALADFVGDALLHEYRADGGQAAYLLVSATGNSLLLAGQICALASLLERRLPGPRRLD